MPLSSLPPRCLRNLDEVDEVLPGVDAELLVDVADVGAHRVERHAELVGDVAGAAPACQKLEDVPLARCQQTGAGEGRAARGEGILRLGSVLLLRT